MTKLKILHPIVVMANGKYPSHAYPLKFLHEAKSIICTDGSANKVQKHDLTPTLIIGDMDSITNINDFQKSEFLHIPKQDNTDLEKVFDYCIDSSINNITVLGATGIRDDLALANLLLSMKYYPKLKIKFITDTFSIECLKGKKVFSSFKRQLVSLIAVYRVKSILTKGLKYSLNKQSLVPSGQGVSNVSNGDKFTVKSSNEILIFRSHK